jgi:hypothetical protein
LIGGRVIAASLENHRHTAALIQQTVEQRLAERLL